ncbi:AAA family ATPase [Clostridium sp. AF50-3]|uniref:ATP-binding protein n=1 Tax=Clostridium sp. AF50-3 TaxID=2293021 RepID=UPI0026826311
MRFLDLYISGFGKFHDTAVSFEDGLNVIYGKNEAGKSTIHTFIRGMLFGIERQRGAPPETTSTANMSHGKTAAPTRGSSGLNPTTAPFTGSSARSRKIRRNLPSSTRRPDARNRTAVPFCRKFWAA